GQNGGSHQDRGQPQVRALGSGAIVELSIHLKGSSCNFRFARPPAPIWHAFGRVSRIRCRPLPDAWPPIKQSRRFVRS
ncbi:MAG TPA: hypothetical protein PKG84_05720, partial [Novosphingobium sp.]|nr:hypothetical protein [Novosphingobium sp.]